MVGFLLSAVWNLTTAKDDETESETWGDEAIHVEQKTEDLGRNRPKERLISKPGE